MAEPSYVVVASGLCPGHWRPGPVADRRYDQAARATASSSHEEVSLPLLVTTAACRRRSGLTPFNVYAVARPTLLPVQHGEIREYFMSHSWHDDVRTIWVVRAIARPISHIWLNKVCITRRALLMVLTQCL
jgi:hypothetical protein